MLGGLGAVLDQRAGVDVEVLAGGPHPVGGQAPGQLGPAALEEGQPGLGGQVAGEGQAEAEAPGVVGAGRLVGVEELLEERPALVGDPVDLARALGARGCAPARRARSPARSPLSEPVEGWGGGRRRRPTR